MKLNSVILADDSESCDIANLFVMMKDSTAQLLEQYASSHEDIDAENHIYSSEAITKQNLSEKLALVNSENFLCCWFGHGTDESFCMNGENVVTTTDNHYVFSNALVYTFSCLNGGKLADVLIDNNAKAFVGYNGNANCPYGIDDVTCGIAMSFLSSLLGGKTIGNAVDDLKTSYEDAIFNKALEPFQRSWFQENRDNVTLKGDVTLTIDNLLIA